MCYNVIKAKDAEKVLVASKNMDKNLIYYLLRPHVKDGILISRKEKWEKRRQLLNHSFHVDILKLSFKVFQENGERVVETLQMKAKDEISLIPMSQELVLDIVCGKFS